MSGEVRVRIRSEVDASRAVLASARYSQDAGFGEVPSQMIATAVSELVRNVLKYAGSGEIRLRRVRESSRRGVEVEVTDRGPGIADHDTAMRDHFSSGGTLGLGLPGVKRMMDAFTLESTPGEGTRVTVRKWL